MTGEEILINLFKKGRSVRPSKGEVVVRGDDKDPWIYYLEKGFIKVYSISDTGDEYLHIIYRQGEIFPLIWALPRKLR